jgi:hypothetical protein
MRNTLHIFGRNLQRNMEQLSDYDILHAVGTYTYTASKSITQNDIARSVEMHANTVYDLQRGLQQTNSTENFPGHYNPKNDSMSETASH